MSPARPQALRDRLSPPDGCASDTAIGPWLRHGSGVPLAYQTGHQCVRDPLRATLQVPRQSPIKKPCSGHDLSGQFCSPPAGETSRGPVHAAATSGARGAPVNYIDETAWYEHGLLAWLWVKVNATVALFKVQASRSKAAFEALVERWAGIVVSDGYGVY